VAVVDPILDADRQNHINDMIVQHFKDSLRLILSNVYQKDGRMAGQVPVSNKLDRLVMLLRAHDFNLGVVNNPQSVPGDVRRANADLVEEERLKREFYEPQPTG